MTTKPNPPPDIPAPSVPPLYNNGDTQTQPDLQPEPLYECVDQGLPIPQPSKTSASCDIYECVEDELPITKPIQQAVQNIPQQPQFLHPVQQPVPQCAPQPPQVSIPVQQPVPQCVPQPPQISTTVQGPVQYVPQQPQHLHPVQQPVTQYVPQQPRVSTIANPVVMVAQMPADVPGQMFCPHCQTNVVTQTDTKFGVYTWTWCFVLGFLMCWPCCLIPFCVKGCKDVEHSCPACNNVLHIHRRR